MTDLSAPPKIPSYVDVAIAEMEDALVFPLLTLEDRCDGADCGAAAASQVAVPGAGILLFCGHHWREQSPAFLARGYQYQEPSDHPEQFKIGTRYTGDNRARDAGSV